MSAALRSLSALLIAVLTCAAWAAKRDVPFLTGRVVDNAEILSAGTVDRITALLKAHETHTTDQVAVLTTRTLGGGSIEEYAVAVFESWKLGQKGKDNGVLVVIVPPERRMRIEVDYGLEGKLTDVEANRIIRNVMAPHFKAGDFDRGVEGGVLAIVRHLKGEATATDQAGDEPRESKSRSGLSGMEDPDLTLTERILFGAFIFGIIGLFTAIGVLTPGMGWYEKAKHDLKTKGRASVGGFVLGGAAGGSSSSWSSSSSSSGGGFSGGGGSS